MLTKDVLDQLWVVEDEELSRLHADHTHRDADVVEPRNAARGHIWECIEANTENVFRSDDALNDKITQ